MNLKKKIEYSPKAVSLILAKIVPKYIHLLSTTSK